MMRTRVMHNKHCEELSGPVSLRDHNATTNGVIRNSSPHSSKFLHVVDGMAPDVMRMTYYPSFFNSTLRDLILKKSLFTIHAFNERLQSFNYAPIDSNNKPT